jgi:hypothetical protein
MDSTQGQKNKIPTGDAATSPVPPGIDADAPPWEMIESGRYMPRRIRGSYRGRELG